jgi:hypothetical protein
MASHRLEIFASSRRSEAQARFDQLRERMVRVEAKKNVEARVRSIHARDIERIVGHLDREDFAEKAKEASRWMPWLGDGMEQGEPCDVEYLWDMNYPEWH